MFPPESIPNATEPVKSGPRDSCRSTALSAVPDHRSAWLQPPVEGPDPQPTCWPSPVPLASETVNPLGFRSTTLSAVPDHNSACLQPPVAGPDPQPACSPAPLPLASEAVNPLGFRSTRLSAVPDHSSACVQLPVAGPDPRPVCWPAPLPLASETVNPLGCRSIVLNCAADCAAGGCAAPRVNGPRAGGSLPHAASTITIQLGAEHNLIAFCPISRTSLRPIPKIPPPTLYLNPAATARAANCTR